MNGVGRQDWQQARPCSCQDYRLQKRPVSLAELAGYAAFFFGPPTLALPHAIIRARKKNLFQKGTVCLADLAG